MKSNRFLERICKKVQRSRKTKASKKGARFDSSETAGVADLQLQKDSVGVAIRQPAASWPLGLASGAFQDSTVPTTTRSMAAVEGVPTSTSLPARMPSQDAPLICVHSAGELERPLLSSNGKERIDVATIQARPATETVVKEVCMLSATDSGLYSEEEGTSEDEFLDVFSDDEEEEDEGLDDGWLIPAEQVSLDKVMASDISETLYSGYWHGNVAVHARYSSSEENYHNILADVSTLSNIRHESIQLFLGVCHDLHSDYISIIMDQMKGESLYTRIHKLNHKFNFQSLTKITGQIAQGMEYLHAKGIPHPLLTTESITLHFRVCISMLSPSSASMGVVDPPNLSYLPPEVMKTVAQHTACSPMGLTCPSSPHSARGLQSRFSSSSSRLSHRLLSGVGWSSSPSSPNLKPVRKQMENGGFLSPGLAVRSSCDDLRNEGPCRKRVQLKGNKSVMQTFEANAFSFGTLLYEMLTSEKPFASTPGNLIIYQIGSGSAYHLNNLHDGKFKQTIRRCWRKDPSSRPSFRELLTTFEQNMSPKSCGLKSHFSFSVPDQLDKLGQFDKGGLNL